MIKVLRLILLACMPLVLLPAPVLASELDKVIQGSGAGAPEDEAVWKEAEVVFPAAPQAARMVSFYVSAAATNQFFIDPAAISVGADGVVRYTLVILAPEGGRSVTYEGMRCSTRERRIYASGRLDGSWSPSRMKQWSVIQDASVNRQYVVLFYGYFCPDGIIVRSADDARHALLHGAPVSGRGW